LSVAAVMLGHMTTFTIEPVGAYSLRESVELGFGQRHAEAWDGAMRLAFCIDGFRSQVGVELREDGDRLVGTIAGHGGEEPDVAVVRAQVARVLSLDHDARGYEAVGDRDPVVAALLRAAPGLRPPLFYSPYEAAVWAVLAVRRPALQAARLRDEISAALSPSFRLGGRDVAPLPLPQVLLAAGDLPALHPEQVARIHGIARAALDGRLDPPRLLGLGPEKARAELQSLRGIGAFYSQLVVVRGTGFTDVLAVEEPRLLDTVRELYGLATAPTPEQLEQIAVPWRPFRTWVCVLMRAASRRLPVAA
jgi:DNA-3-methyladenine glycosylase II